MATVLFRTIVIYLLLICAIRLTGKRQIGELQISELIITFMISELATAPIQDLSIPLSYSILPIVFLLCFEVIVSFLMTKSDTLKKLLSGNPAFLIKNGVLNQKELARLRIGINEFLGELRLKDVSDIADVDYAILEQNGKLSVFLKSNKQVVSLEDLQISKSKNGISHAIIIDGTINKSNLKYANKTEQWLNKYLSSKNKKIESIYLMTIDDGANINIINKKEN